MNIKLTKIEDEVQEKLSIIVKKMNDPRVPSLLSFTKVTITPDLSYAKVYVSIVEEINKKNVIKTLNKASGFFRSKIANCMKLRKTPNFQFILDDSIENAFKITKILSDIS